MILRTLQANERTPARPAAVGRIRLFSNANFAQSCQKMPAHILRFRLASFRNPSLWRQSGANVLSLPPFFGGLPHTQVIESEKECLSLPSSLLPSHSPVPYLAASALQMPRSAMQQQAQRLARPQHSSLAEAGQTQPLPLQLVPSQAQRFQQTKSRRPGLSGRAHANYAVRPARGERFFCVRRTAISTPVTRALLKEDTQCSTRS